MRIAIAHVAAEQQDRIVEQGAVTFLDRIHFFEEARELANVPSLDLDVLRHFLRVILVMRGGMVAFVDTHHRISTVGKFTRHHERGHAGGLGLVCQNHQVKHHLQMLFIVKGNTRRRVRNHEVGIARNRHFGLLQAALYFANAFQVVVDFLLVTLPQGGVQGARLANNAIENAAIFRLARETLLNSAALPEQTFKHFTRIDFHRVRRGRSAPRQRVHIDTAIVAVAGADQTAVIFSGEFQRGQRRVLTDHLRGELVGGDTGESI